MACFSALILVSACADDPAPKPIASLNRHASPTAVPAPVLPEGTFDQERARQSLAAAQAARQAGQLPEARHQAELAIEAWPADPAAWQLLVDICQAGGDLTCRRQADFFRAKVEYANTLPTRAAVLGFQTIVEEPEGTTGSGITYDRKSHEAATRLWAFYDAQDALKSRRGMPPSDGATFAERHPYAPAILVIGVVAGVLTEANALAK